MQSLDAHSLEFALGRPHSLPGTPNDARPGALVWDDGPDGGEAPPGPGPLDALPSRDDPPWIALTDEPARARDLLARGFRAALKRQTSPETLAAAIDAVSRGLVVTDPSFLPLTPPPPPRDETLHLSPREHEVLALLAEGLSNKEIAAELSLSPHTAKFHVTALLDKLGAQTRTEAVVRAARAGLLAL